MRKITKHFKRIDSVAVEIRNRHLLDVSELCQHARLQESKLNLRVDALKVMSSLFTIEFFILEMLFALLQPITAQW